MDALNTMFSNFGIAQDDILHDCCLDTCSAAGTYVPETAVDFVYCELTSSSMHQDPAACLVWLIYFISSHAYMAYLS